MTKYFFKNILNMLIFKEFDKKKMIQNIEKLFCYKVYLLFRILIEYHIKLQLFLTNILQVKYIFEKFNFLTYNLFYYYYLFL